MDDKGYALNKKSLYEDLCLKLKDFFWISSNENFYFNKDTCMEEVI